MQPALLGLMDGSVSTLAPLFAAAILHHHQQHANRKHHELRRGLQRGVQDRDPLPFLPEFVRTPGAYNSGTNCYPEASFAN